MEYDIETPENNRYQVITEHSEYFHLLTEAEDYYNSLEDAAQLWKVEGSPKLLKEKKQMNFSLFQ